MKIVLLLLIVLSFMAVLSALRNKELADDRKCNSCLSDKVARLLKQLKIVNAEKNVYCSQFDLVMDKLDENTRLELRADLEKLKQETKVRTVNKKTPNDMGVIRACSRLIGLIDDTEAKY